jgi:hypothetical protein
LRAIVMPTTLASHKALILSFEAIFAAISGW